MKIKLLVAALTITLFMANITLISSFAFAKGPSGHKMRIKVIVDRRALKFDRLLVAI